MWDFVNYEEINPFHKEFKCEKYGIDTVYNAYLIIDAIGKLKALKACTKFQPQKK